MSWLKTGAESEALQRQDQEEFEERKKGFALPYRFFIPRNSEPREITFIDGELDARGYLTPPRFFEHTITNSEGRLEHYICPKRTDPKTYKDCPLCNSGNRATLMGVFTIIDHSVYTNDQTGEVFQDRVRLMAVKPQAFDLLAHQAKTHGGLDCRRFLVSRVGEKSSGTGDVFEFIDHYDRQVLRNTYFRVEEPTQEDLDQAAIEGLPAPKPTRKTNFVPVDYANAIPFYTPEQLADLGMGQLQAIAGNVGAKSFNNGKQFKSNYVPPSQQNVDDGIDYSAQL